MKIHRTLPLALAVALLISTHTVSVAQQQNPPSALDPVNESRPSDPSTTPGTATPERLPIKIFNLVNSNANESARLLSQLFSNEGIWIQPDPRTNVIMVRGPEATLLEVEAILVRLDAQESRSDAGLMYGQGGAPRAAANPYTAAGAARSTGTSRQPDAEAAQLAAKYQQAAAGQREELKSQLERAVEAAFEARQQAQRAELAQLRERFARIEQSLAARERVKDKIVANRVSELLDPNLQWEPGAESPNPAGMPRATTQQPRASATQDPLSSDATAPGGDSQFVRRHWPSATLPGGNVILRSAEEFGRELSDADTAIHNQKLFQRGFLSQSKVIADQRRLKAIQDEYAAQIRLLELELQNAQSTMEAARAELRRSEQLNQRGGGSVTSSDVDRQRLQVEQARIRLEQLKTLLDLYRSAGKTDDDAKAGTAPPDASGTSDEHPAKKQR